LLFRALSLPHRNLTLILRVALCALGSLALPIGVGALQFRLLTALFRNVRLPGDADDAGYQ
jgi:hypothetical protein